MSTAAVIPLYSCPKCQKAVHPIKQLRPSSAASPTMVVGDAVGFVNCCPHCFGGVVVCDGRTDDGPPQVAAALVATPQAKPKAPATANDDVLGMAKRRLEFVREQISSLRKFEAEEAMLQRMVEAAEAE